MFVPLFIPLQERSDIRTGIRPFVFRNFLGSTCRYDLPSAFTAFGAEIYDIIRCLDHIKIMFYHNNGISALSQALQYLNKFMDIGKMKTRCRLIKNIYRLSCAPSRKLRGKLDTLCLTAGKCCGRLTQLYISEPDLI